MLSLLSENIKSRGREFLIENIVALLIKTTEEYVFVISEPDKKEELRKLLEKKITTNLDIIFIYSTRDNIINTVRNAEKDKCLIKNINTIQKYIDTEVMELNTRILALNYSLKDVSIEKTLEHMGFWIAQKEKS